MEQGNENKKFPGLNSLKIIRIVIGVISFIPCLYIIFKFLTKKEIRTTFNNTLNFMLCISCLGQSCCYFIYYKDNVTETSLCRWQGTLLTSFFFVSLILTTLIGLISYLLFLNPDFLNEEYKVRKIIICLIPWVLGIIYAIMVWFFGWEGVVQKDNNNIKPGKTHLCWFEADEFNTANFFLDSIFLIMNILIIALLLRKISLVLNEEGQKEIFKHYFHSLIRYIIVQILVYCPLIVTGIKSTITIFWNKELSQPNWWIYIRDILEGLAGLLFSAVYGYTIEIKVELYHLCGKKIGVDSEENQSKEAPLGDIAEENDDKEYIE